MPTPKVLTITMKFEIGDRKIHAGRVKAASDAAVAAATAEVQKNLLEGCVENVTASTTWAYHWAEFGSTIPLTGTDDPEPDSEV
ncbi:hypothetical protein JOF53_007078 [Crossiella equi]|uniref:Uncharacterized protein n=1 Tax=Crossiella equi TaxID=130796 RepID=A0ABS5AP57_9PSEU|nr:hypothetical protein [Crossiella equi]MBP2478206.1 hypothetical protein [Crossiella equi]